MAAIDAEDFTEQNGPINTQKNKRKKKTEDTDVEDISGENMPLETACDSPINTQKKKKKKKTQTTEAEDVREDNETLETATNPQKNMTLSDLLETFRNVSENTKHWGSRREFLFRNFDDYEDPHVDQLLALSMVWANHVFLGCRYGPALLEKVTEMAEGIVVEDAPVFKTRDELIKQQKR